MLIYKWRDRDGLPNLQTEMQNENVGRLCKKYEGFRDGNIRASNQKWGPLKPRALGDGGDEGRS